MLERLVVKGFQSHTDTELVFDKQVNVVKGDNGSGKSALRRALFWVLTNKPTGTAFINWGFSDITPCEVSVVYNGHTITRRRSRDGKINEYVVDGEVLTAFGVSIPSPVSQILNLDDTNIELQHSALFMLSESAPDMARRLNKLTNLEDIDKAYGSIRRRKLEAGRKIKDEESRKADIRQELEKYDFLPKAEETAKKLEVIHELSQDLERDAQGVLELSHSLAQVLANIKPSAPVTSQQLTDSGSMLRNVGLELQAIDDLISVWPTSIPEHSPFPISQVEDVRNELVKQQAEMQSLKQLLTDIEGIKIMKNPPISSREIGIEKIKGIMDEWMDVSKLMETIHAADVDIAHNQELYTRTKVEYDELMPETCPLCGSFTHNGECV